MNLINHFLKASALVFASNAAMAADDIPTDDTLRGSPILVNSLTETIFGDNDDRTIVEDAALTRPYIGGIAKLNDDGSLFTFGDDNSYIFCTATIVEPPGNFIKFDPRPLILTAGHCFNPKNVDQIKDGLVMTATEGAGLEAYTQKIPNYVFISNYVDDETGNIQQYRTPIAPDSINTDQFQLDGKFLTDTGFALLSEPVPAEISPISMKTGWARDFTYNSDIGMNVRDIQTNSVNVGAYGFSFDVPDGMLAVHENCGIKEVNEYMSADLLQTHCDIRGGASGGPLILKTTEDEEFVVGVHSSVGNYKSGVGGAPLDPTHPYALDNKVSERFTFHAIISDDIIPGALNSEEILPTPAIVKPPKL